MSWRLIDTDGLSETWSHVDGQGVTHVVDRQNDAPLLKRNEELRQMAANSKSNLRPLASIPIVEARRWVKEAGINEVDFWQNWTAREQNRFFALKYKSNEFHKLRINPEPLPRIFLGKELNIPGSDNVDRQQR